MLDLVNKQTDKAKLNAKYESEISYLTGLFQSNVGKLGGLQTESDAKTKEIQYMTDLLTKQTASLKEAKGRGEKLEKEIAYMVEQL